METNLLDRLVSLKKDEELSGGKKVLARTFNKLLKEIRMAENVLGSGHYADLEGKGMELIGRMQMSQFQEAQGSSSEAISLSTPSCQAAMKCLQKRKLIWEC
jgi:hypothetical protein